MSEESEKEIIQLLKQILAELKTTNHNLVVIDGTLQTIS